MWFSSNIFITVHLFISKNTFSFFYSSCCCCRRRLEGGEELLHDLAQGLVAGRAQVSVLGNLEK